MQPGALYYGDCLEVMKRWPRACVDLIYLDPPFNSKANYNILFGTGKAGKEKTDLAQLTAFTDTWQWNEDAQGRVERIENAVEHPAHLSISGFHKMHPDGSGMLSYLSYMAERLAVMRKVLKDTGSIYLHCDLTATHYLKIVMDEVFGSKNFRNEIIWYYFKPHSSKTNYPKNYDTILFYTKSNKYSFNHEETLFEYDEKSIKRYDKADKHGRRYKTYFGKDGVERTAYLKSGRSDNVFKIPFIQGTSKERLGYPTQKPRALLERIINASSNAGDLVLDPFCGCGTTIEAAHRLHRRWIGIDISTYAIEVIRRERMNDMEIPVQGVPKDFAAARHFAREKPFDFEKWAVTRIRGFAPNTVQRGDGGIDGRGMLHNPALKNGLCIAQVKGGTPNANDLRAFCGALAGGKAALGVFITLKKWNSPTVRQCIAEAGKLAIGANEYNRLVMYSIDEHFNHIQPTLPPLAHPRTGEALHEDLLDLRSDGRR